MRILPEQAAVVATPLYTADTYYILEPLRSALFLTNFPASHLSYAYLLTALFAGSLSALIFRLTRRRSAISMMTGVNLGIIVPLLFFRWATGGSISWVPYAYFIYVQMVPALSTAMFWLLAGYVYDSCQSRRLFPLLGFGAILGAMTGSMIPGFLSGRLSVQSMMSICALVCLLLIVLSRLIWRRRRENAERAAARKSEEREASAGDIVRTVFGSRHLSLMVDQGRPRFRPGQSRGRSALPFLRAVLYRRRRPSRRDA